VLAFLIYIYIKVKQSHYRSGQALRVPGGLRLPDFKIIALAVFTPQEIFLLLISVRG
jgi:hypothetical protein